MKEPNVYADAIDTINDLININLDRIKGYEKAIQNTDTMEAEVNTVYSRMMDESYSYNKDLAEKVVVLGGKVASDTTVPGKIYHAWMDLKATFTGNDTKSTLAACEFGEDAAQKAYANALENDDLPADIYDLINKQKLLLKASHDLVRQYRDHYAEA